MASCGPSWRVATREDGEVTRRLLLVLLAFASVAVVVVLGVVSQLDAGRDEEFGTVDEYRLDPWVDVGLYGVDVGFLETPSALDLVGAALFAGFAVWLWRRDRRRRRA